ncbi:MAG TPA: triphosphoribosyl-dephospho-CoA synthase [Pseudolabrys sp.]|nr:triphosphoribosyl-dephospho-CoA synthase [Pseudolabrys sp.]
MPERSDLTTQSGRIAAAFVQACRDELEAPKPGNVHAFADGHRMTAGDFERSAAAAARPLAMPRARVGVRIFRAVEAGFAAVGVNTNLGIILLCAPLAAAAEADRPNLRASLSDVLQKLDRDDAEFAFRAIVRASPGGLGRSERHDVFQPAAVSLREAMAEASDRDRIARQYVTNFADVFEIGEALYAAERRASADRRKATVAAYLGLLAAFPDTHIVRKHGVATAEQVRREATGLQAKVRHADELDEIMPILLAWDAELKQAGINPGTSADLTVATVFAHHLRGILPPKPIGD